ncbi:hypothetical protein ACFWN1_14595 [Streptomyces sp. NPDC058459]|uniref:hypothetical protein n=1 Tax=Streptomyces sp. NPDC058459 TaxID=3346508 RepID=UPI003648E631
MSLRDFARSLKPGRDEQLADDLAAQQRVRRSRSAARAAREGQKWEDQDRARDRRGGIRLTRWED